MTTFSLRPAFSSVLRLLVVGVILAAVHGVLAQAPTAPPQDQIASELIGARVFTSEGSEVGEVSAVSIGPGGQISELRMTLSSPLGLGQRVVVLPTGSFTLLRGAVVVDLMPEELNALPSPGKGELGKGA
jgi:hypothetical protein